MLYTIISLILVQVIKEEILYKLNDNIEDSKF